MASRWKQLKLALAIHRCVYAPRTLGDDPPSTSVAPSEANLLAHESGTMRPLLSQVFRLSKKDSKSTKQTCSICLGVMRQGGGHAIFTAECNHSFHFHCIASNVKHGSMICPVCRAKWKEIPLQAPSLSLVRRSSSVNDGLMTVVRRLPTRREISRRREGQFHISEPAVFDDDESIDFQTSTSNNLESTICINTHSEISAVDWRTSVDNFTMLINVKAAYPRTPARAPVDLVTVVDVSGSMAGMKLGLLKKAMGFVIQNLGSNDRLSVVAFSSNACRLFPLRRMNESGRQQALVAVNSLTANGGTNIAEGLKRGAKVMEERKKKNHVANMILLSDGQDTYNVTNESLQNYVALLPEFQIPVHAFGFGSDHDASVMHAISQMSKGTFSFVENEAVLQDAFAQCIGGLLSVVAQGVQLKVECANPSSVIASLEAGGYRFRLTESGRTGHVDIGDLYADEEKDILVSVNIPVEPSADRTSILYVSCVYRDPFSHEIVDVGNKLTELDRSELSTGGAVVSVEVDRQRNRLRAAEAMSRAGVAAEKGDLGGAVSVLEDCRKALMESVSGVSGDRLCAGLVAELKEMQERLGSKNVYEASGRAYILSGLSSHSLQRATARGDSTDGSSLIQSYQTPNMTQMLTRSQLLRSKHW